MHLGDFEYVAPTSKAGVLSILAECGEVKVLAGGQSLIPAMGHLAGQAHVSPNDVVDSAVVKVEN